MARVLILGSGFGAMALAGRLDPRAHDVTVVSPRNHFVFTPLLPSAAVGTLEFRTIIEPVRRGRPALRFHLASAEEVDLARRAVVCRALEEGGAGPGRTWEEPYDALVIAVGARPNTFDIPGAREHAYFLKELADARRIREALVWSLERASLPGVPEEERRRLLSFVAVGGGPTGVRFAAELQDLLRDDVPGSYPRLAREAAITILDAGREILGSYAPALRRYTTELLAREGVSVRAGARVAEVTATHVRLASGERIASGLTIWGAGFAAAPLVERLPLARDRQGRILTDACLRVPGHEGVFALGDCARPEGQDLPQLAQVAEQQGRHLARTLARPAPFAWRSGAVSTYLGAGRAVVDGPGGHGSATGAWAYWLWRTSVHSQLVSVRNKVLVPLDRMRARVFGRDLSKF